MKKSIQKDYITDLVRLRVQNRPALRRAKGALADRYHTTIIPNSELLQNYRQVYKGKEDQRFVELLRKRSIRTQSGVAPVTVLTKPYPCPGRCVYCPAPAGMPKSYLKSEPAAQRAHLLKFDPYRQVSTRIRVLEGNGHSAGKIELIVLGGTWSHYPKRYREWFVKRCFDGANGSTSATLALAQKKNERAPHRIIGLSLETRPDHVTPDELRHMRLLGCTHVQIGVQTLHQDILDYIHRDDTLENIARATALLREFGFKITYHIMPGLPGSTPAKDLAVFKKLFSDPRFQPDMLKIYPCVVIKNSLLYRWYQQGKYKPYSNAVLEKLLIRIKALVPPYVRINRLIRDIPGHDIVAGNRVTNLRQLLREQGVTCMCIRCREVRGAKFQLKDIRLVHRKYSAAAGTEHLISFESPDRKRLYAFVRLRLPAIRGFGEGPFDAGTALVRELHTYGELVSVGSKKKAVQHVGLGKRLMAEAERIGRNAGYQKIAVIAGIGVREYYRKLGYRLKRTYMEKEL
ncbi:MAG: tRNA uridine(34) 5-carboxymethylaminomethyl modification radical SAM/GNAT enzyme Elp3 [Patescibacteria group bacterium]|nr:tRNA uridine(34) 5-carboxymethylaminomethyl modification radical SAM/GNAT enzyme Elp3 [Patescibacteria group bacterium]MDD5715832.1 tRNA uridine(34) 5-carboxymethylaminomethyl modification radical SAM/GNAT enzyme Elp3 [Patescibacteria group bacterium]